MSSSEIRVESVRSDVLQGNALGDPAERKVLVYLPPDHRPGTTAYPVVFILAGFGGSGASLLDYEPWDETIQQTMDRLLAEGRVRPMIVVLPDAMTRYGGSQYINSPATGRYQDYLVELLDWVDQTFPTVASRDHRAIAGKSSGGFGALRMAMDRPEIFGLVVDHSGDKYFEYAYRPDFPRLHRTLRDTPDFEAILRDPRSHRPHDQAFRDLLEAAALSSCYSPNASAPLGFDLPIDIETGAVRETVWEQWLLHDPLVRIQTRPEALRDMRLIFLDCGRRDEFYLDVGMRLLHAKLAERGIDHEYTEHDEGHFNLNYRYALSLEAISRAFPGPGG
jgi:enterochelin esterase-like enzyme